MISHNRTQKTNARFIVGSPDLREGRLLARGSPGRLRVVFSLRRTQKNDFKVYIEFQPFFTFVELHHQIHLNGALRMFQARLRGSCCARHVSSESTCMACHPIMILIKLPFRPVWQDSRGRRLQGQFSLLFRPKLATFLRPARVSYVKYVHTKCHIYVGPVGPLGFNSRNIAQRLALP